jgi:hypothetical protein
MDENPWRAHLAAFFDALERHDTAIRGMQTAAKASQTEDGGDGYRLANAFMELRRLCYDEERLLAELLGVPMEANAELHVMGFRGLVLMAAVGLDRLLASDAPTDGEIARVSTRVQRVLGSRGDMDSLAP